MGAGDRARWDARWSAAAARERSEPEPFVLRALAGLGRGRALDLACGAGRHALALARAGWSVEAWDVSPVALAELARRAAGEDLAIEAREVDLEAPLPAVEPFDLVLVVDYLDRALYARLADLVGPGGHALVSTFTREHPGEHPSPRFRLEPGELAAGLPGLAVVAHEERDGRASLLARR